MRWDAVLQAIASRMATDPGLLSVYTAAGIRKMGTQKFLVPSLEYLLITSGMDEVWEPHLVQFSQWTSTMADLAVSDRRLHALFGHEEPMFIEGVYMWSFFEDSSDLQGPEREGYHGMASMFQFTPIRERLLR